MVLPRPRHKRLLSFTFWGALLPCSSHEKVSAALLLFMLLRFCASCTRDWGSELGTGDSGCFDAAQYVFSGVKETRSFHPLVSFHPKGMRGGPVACITTQVVLGIRSCRVDFRQTARFFLFHTTERK